MKYTFLKGFIEDVQGKSKYRLQNRYEVYHEGSLSMEEEKKRGVHSSGKNENLVETTDLVLDYCKDSGIAYRARIGVIILSCDQTLSYEVHQMLSIDGIAIDEAKQETKENPDKEVSVDSLSLQRENIITSSRLINSREVPDVVAYGCTSGAMAMGNNTIAAMVREVFPDARVTDPLTGTMAALKVLRGKSIALISPYPKEVNDGMVDYLTAHGYRVPVTGRFYKEGVNPTHAAPFINHESIEKAILELGSRKDVDTVFISCTQMRCAEIIDRMEERLGKPVISANQALCWHALRLAGCRDRLKGWGSLFNTNIVPE